MMFTLLNGFKCSQPNPPILHFSSTFHLMILAVISNHCPDPLIHPNLRNGRTATSEGECLCNSARWWQASLHKGAPFCILTNKVWVYLLFYSLANKFCCHISIFLAGRGFANQIAANGISVHSLNCIPLIIMKKTEHLFIRFGAICIFLFLNYLAPFFFSMFRNSYIELLSFCKWCKLQRTFPILLFTFYFA